MNLRGVCVCMCTTVRKLRIGSFVAELGKCDIFIGDGLRYDLDIEF